MKKLSIKIEDLTDNELQLLKEINNSEEPDDYSFDINSEVNCRRTILFNTIR